MQLWRAPHVRILSDLTLTSRVATVCWLLVFQFAHGVMELRSREFDSKYKTELCKNYYLFGPSSCFFASRCKFIRRYTPVHNSGASRGRLVHDSRARAGMPHVSLHSLLILPLLLGHSDDEYRVRAGDYEFWLVSPHGRIGSRAHSETARGRGKFPSKPASHVAPC